MSNAFKARLKVAVVSAAAAVSITGAMALLPNVVRAVTIDELLAQIAALQAQIAALQTGGSVGGGTSAKCTFTRSLTVGARGDDVKCLQQYLNANGYQIAASGAGSAGNETTYFGGLTRAAVARWQAGNGVSPAVGYFGTISRAKYDVLVAGTPGTPVTPGTPTPAGSGLSVSAGVQPAETLAPESAARLPYVRLTLTAANDGDVTVSSITVKREGLADDTAFDTIILLDEDGTQIGNSKTLNANHQLTLDRAFVVKKGTSKVVTVAANMAADLDQEAGQVAKLTVTAINAGSAAVSGSLPISSNGMTINGTLAIGTLTSPVRGALDPGADTTKEVGTKNFVFSAVKFTAGSGEDLLMKSIRFDQSGSASDSDLKNLKISIGGTDYETMTDGKKYWATFGDGITVAKGGNIDISIKGDIESGSNRTVSFDVEKKTDIVVVGKTYGYYITAGGGSAGAASDGGFSSNQEPYFNAYDHTINVGTLRAEKSNAITAGNVAVDISNTSLGAFTFEAKGEDVQISKMVLHFTFTGTGTSSDVTNVQIVDEAGATVAGPKDPASGIVTFTDTWNVPPGTKVYKVQGKLDTTFVSNDTVQVGVVPGNFTAKGLVTGKAITPTPSTMVTANTQTVRAAALKVSVSPSPVAQNVVRGINGFLFATLQYDATNSGEDIRITAQKVTDTVDAAGNADNLNNCQMFDGTTALNTGSNVINPVDTTDTTNEQTYTFDNHLVIPKGTTKSVSLKCNISASATSDSTHSYGLSATAADADTTATGVTTGTTVTETYTSGAGQVMTIKTGGSFTVAKDTSSPTERWGIAGSADQVATVFKLHATDEALRLERFHLAFSSTTASTTDFSKVTLWDGATKVGEAVFAGSDTVATSTLTSDFIIPKDGDKLLTAKVDIANVGTAQSGKTARLLAVRMNGAATTSTRVIGQSSGSAFNLGTATDVAGDGIRLAKAYPTLARVSVPSNTLANGTMTFYRFSVAAPSAGDVGLYKFTFAVSSTTVATTTNLSVYGYSDSAFSVQAYGNNPLNARAVDIVGEDSLNTAATSTTVGDIEVYFDPVTASATGPNSEQIQVPAGTTRYFELRGTIAGATAGDAINVSLLGDAAFAGISNTGDPTLQANDVDVQTTNNDFIWSPNTTTTSATTTKDWVNGFRLPGLPSTNMEQQTFSK